MLLPCGGPAGQARSRLLAAPIRRPAQPASAPARVQRGPGPLRAVAIAGAAVKVIVQGRGLEVTEPLRSFATEKLQKVVGKYEAVVREVDIKLTAVGGQEAAPGGKRAKAYRTEITLYTLRNGVVRAEDQESALYPSIEQVADVVARKLARLKGKATKGGKWPGHARGQKGAVSASKDGSLDGAEEDLGLDLEGEGEYEGGGGAGERPFSPDDIVRVKHTEVPPMSVEDAVNAVEQLGHSFYLFRDKDSGEVRLLYKRRAFGYGVIVPQ